MATLNIYQSSTSQEPIAISNNCPGEFTFPNYGNGILLFTSTRNKKFFIEIAQNETDPCDVSSIILTVQSKEVSFLAQSEGKTKLLLRTNKSSIGENVGYDPDKRVTYWWSYDSNEMTIKYGKGYYMEQTTFMSYTFKDEKGNKENYFDPTKTKIVRIHETHPYPNSKGQSHKAFAQLQMIQDDFVDIAEAEQEVLFRPHPLTFNRSPFVQDSSASNLFGIDLGKYTYSSSLPDACKVLYANVTGENMSLDYGEQMYKFTDAMRHSIESKDGILHKMLEEKKGEFGPDNEVYLRVTLGKNFGNSPGAPYVMEIWPKKCGSPVHNHGNACAVIRVLQGGLKIFVYNKHAKDSGNPKPIMSFDVIKDDVTWISPNWYQTHRLLNDTDDFCVTIQCYQFGDTDDIHWRYFDYVDSKTGSDDNFAPDSDFGFTDMYNKVMKEYEDYMRPKTPSGKTRKRKNERR